MTDVAPQNLDAEDWLLGAVLVSRAALERVSDLVSPEDFYRIGNGAIFRAALELLDRGEAVDSITTAEQLDRAGALEEAGGRVRLHELANIVPASANAPHWAKIIREHALRRRLINLGMEISALGYEGQLEASELVDHVDRKVLELKPELARHETIYSAKDIVASFREKLAHPLDDLEGVPTPWKFLRPLKGGRMYVLAAYTGHGKTASAIQFLRSACEAGKKVDFASIEMSAADLTDRLVSTFGVPHEQCTSGRISSVLLPVVNAALERIESWDLHIIDDESIDVAGLRRHIRIRRPDLLVIDHLHRIDWNERRELERAIRGITNLGREYEIPILLLAQLKRSGDWKDPFPRPTLSQLKETSVLEQEAYAVWFIWRKTNEFGEPTTETEFSISKNRGGPLGHQRMTFVPNEVRFEWTGVGGLIE